MINAMIKGFMVGAKFFGGFIGFMFFMVLFSEFLKAIGY